MPLFRGRSQAVISRNIAELIRSGKDKDQAAAIAYAKAGRTGKMRLTHIGQIVKEAGAVGNPYHDAQGRFSSGSGGGRAGGPNISNLSGRDVSPFNMPIGSKLRPGDAMWNTMQPTGDTRPMNTNLVPKGSGKSVEEQFGYGPFDPHHASPPAVGESPKAQTGQIWPYAKPSNARIEPKIPARNVGPYGSPFASNPLKGIPHPKTSRPKTSPAENSKPANLPEWDKFDTPTRGTPRIKGLSYLGELLSELLMDIGFKSKGPKQAAPKSDKLKIGNKRDLANAITALSPSGFRGNKVQLPPDERAAAKNNIDKRIGQMAIADEDKKHLRDRLHALKGSELPADDRTMILEWLHKFKNDGGNGDGTVVADGPTLNGPSNGNDKQFGIFSNPGVAGRMYASPRPASFMNRRKTGLQIHKAADGARYMFLVTSNSYKDRDNETVTTKALSDYVTKAWSGEQFAYQPLYFWHDDTLPAIGRIVWADMEGPFLIEVAKERVGNPFAKTVWDFIEANPNFKWGASHGFDYLKGIEGGSGIYKAIRKFETSVLPLKAASNPYTFATVLEGRDMNAKDTFLDKMLGAPGATQRLRKGVKHIKNRLDEAGMVPRAKQIANADELSLEDLVEDETIEQELPMTGQIGQRVLKGILDDVRGKLDDVISEFYDEPPEGLDEILLAALLSPMNGAAHAGGGEVDYDQDDDQNGMDYMNEGEGEKAAAYMAQQADQTVADPSQQAPSVPAVPVQAVAAQGAPQGHAPVPNHKHQVPPQFQKKPQPGQPVATEEKAQDGYADEFGEETGWVQPELSSGAAIKKPTYATQPYGRTPQQKAVADQRFKSLEEKLDQIGAALGEVAEMGERLDKIENRRTWLPRAASDDPGTAITDEELVESVKSIQKNLTGANDPFWNGAR